MSEDAHDIAVPAHAPLSETPRPAVGTHLHFPQTQQYAEVIEHTARGFRYRGDHKISLVNQGVYGTGEGEVFTDIPEWDCMVRTRMVELLP